MAKSFLALHFQDNFLPQTSSSKPNCSTTPSPLFPAITINPVFVNIARMQFQHHGFNVTIDRQLVSGHSVTSRNARGSHSGHDRGQRRRKGPTSKPLAPPQTTTAKPTTGTLDRPNHLCVTPPSAPSPHHYNPGDQPASRPHSCRCETRHATRSPFPGVP